MKIWTICQVIVILSSFIYSADKFATTESGAKVILHDDGKWQYDSLNIKKDTSQKKIEPLFRGTKWGQTKQQIKQIEKAKLIGDTSATLVYKLTTCGFDALLGYNFTNNKLFRATYIFTEEHTNLNIFIDDYATIKILLMKIYGEPKEDKTDWSNDLLKNDRDKWGMAISMGQLAYFTTWENTSTIIALSLQKGDYSIKMSVEYLSKEFGQEAINKFAKDF
jgi:hypothetical protein